MIAEGVASAIVNDDFEQVLSDILSVEKPDTKKVARPSARDLQRE